MVIAKLNGGGKLLEAVDTGQQKPAGDDKVPTALNENEQKGKDDGVVYTVVTELKVQEKKSSPESLGTGKTTQGEVANEKKPCNAKVNNPKSGCKPQNAVGAKLTPEKNAGGVDSFKSGKVSERKWWSNLWICLTVVILLIGCACTGALLFLSTFKHYQASHHQLAMLKSKGGSNQDGSKIDSNWTCNSIRSANPSAQSGEYRVTLPCGREFYVYCDMTSGNGYPITFLSRNGVLVLSETGYNISLFLKDPGSIFVRTMHGDGSQTLSLMQQMNRYRSLALGIGLGGFDDFHLPLKIDNSFFGKPFLFSGFLPISDTATKSQAAELKVNGQRQLVNNYCGYNDSNYIAIFPNQDGRKQPQSNDHVNSTGPPSSSFCKNIFQGKKLAAKEKMPKTYFMFGEAQFGNCICHTISSDEDDVDADLDLFGLSIGFR